MRRSTGVYVLLCVLAFSSFAEAALPRAKHARGKLDEPTTDGPVDPRQENAHNTPLTTSEQLETLLGLSVAVIVIVSIIFICLIVACCIAWANRGAMLNMKGKRRGGHS